MHVIPAEYYQAVKQVAFNNSIIETRRKREREKKKVQKSLFQTFQVTASLDIKNARERDNKYSCVRNIKLMNRTNSHSQQRHRYVVFFDKSH